MKHLQILILLLSLMLTGTVHAQSPDRSKPPASEKPKDLKLPPIEKFSLSNGLKVVMMEKKGVPLVQVNLYVESGPFHDPIGKEGLSAFAVDLMDEGAGQYDALKLSDEIDFLGAVIRTYSTEFRSVVACSTPSSRLDQSLALFSAVAISPTFPQAEIERKQKEWTSSFLQEFDNPEAIAYKAFNQLLFGKISPYGRNATERSVKTFKREDLIAWHKMNFIAGNSTIVIVGDVTKEKITSLLEQTFSAYSAATMKRMANPIPTQYKSRKIFIVNKPGAAQSIISIGALGPERSTPDFNAIQVFNTILGGSFTSRLNTNLRETHGYSYGAFSNFQFWPVPGPFNAQAAVQTDATGASLKEFFNEFSGIIKAIPEGELDRGRNYEALGYASNFVSTSSISNRLYEYVSASLPDDYFNTYVGKILAVKNTEAEAAARKYIRPDKFLVVIVGDAAKIEAEVKKQKLGTPTILSIDDILGKKPKL